MVEQSRSHLDRAKVYLDDMRHQVKVCNGKSLANYTASAVYAIKGAFYDKEIDMHTARELQKQANEIIYSFDKNCTCRERSIKKK